MQSDNVILFKTHKINDAVIAELKKIKKSNYDYYLLCDNSKNFFSSRSDTYFSEVIFKGETIKSFIMGKNCFDSSKLPIIEQIDPINYGKIHWYNGDYCVYIFYDHLSIYRKYMLIEYDCFLNDYNYQEFADVNFNIDADFISYNITKCDYNGNWEWSHNIEWAFRRNLSQDSSLPQLYGTIFPVTVFSNQSIPLLKQKRIELGKIFINKKNNFNSGIWKWPFCEIFVPTTISILGMKCASLKKIGHLFSSSNEIDLSQIRIFENKDGLIYHPVKGIFNQKILNLQFQLMQCTNYYISYSTYVNKLNFERKNILKHLPFQQGDISSILNLLDIDIHLYKHKEALNILTKALDNYNNEKAYIKVIDLLLELYNFSTSFSIARKALKNNLDSGWPYILFSKIYLSCSKINKAIYFAQQSIKKEIFNLEYRSYLIDLLLKRGNWNSVYKKIKENLELNPSWGRSYRQLSYFYTIRGEMDEAIFYARKAVDIDFHNMTNRVHLLNILFKKGDLEQIEPLIKEGFDINPYWSQGYRQLSYLYEIKGNLEQALIFAQKAVKIECYNMAHRVHLLTILRKKGDLGFANK